MSRERTLRNIATDIRSRSRGKGRPLQGIINEQQRGTSFTGEVWEPIYRNDKVCRRHLLIDEVVPFLKKRFNRVARRVAKRQIAQAA